MTPTSRDDEDSRPDQARDDDPRNSDDEREDDERIWREVPPHHRD